MMVTDKMMDGKCPGNILYNEFENYPFNPLAPGKVEWNFRYVIFNGFGISCEIALIWMSLDFTDDQSTLVQVMA